MITSMNFIKNYSVNIRIIDMITYISLNNQVNARI